MINMLAQNLDYLFMLFFIMISAGLAKEYNLFAPAYSYIKKTFKSNKAVLVLLSMIGGILPIEGRVTISAGLIDTIASKEGESREKLGIVDYLATHHYYMWSPLEKTVILPIAFFGLTYIAWLKLIAPLLIASIIFISLYIWFYVKGEDIVIQDSEFKISAIIRNIFPMFLTIGSYITGFNFILSFGLLALYYMFLTQQWDIKKLLSYIKWDTLFVVAIVIILGNYIKLHNIQIEELIKQYQYINGSTALVTACFVGFFSSFFMGSSGKFVAFALLLTKLFGIQYFLLFFAVEFAGYLISPTHKCVAIGNSYFNTPLIEYYKVLIGWGCILISVAWLFCF